MRIKHALSAVGLAMLLSACQDKPAPAPAPSQQDNATTTPDGETSLAASRRFLDIADNQAKLMLRKAPLLATSLGVSEDYVGVKFNDKLGDFSLQAAEEQKQLNKEFLSQLSQIDRRALEGTAATTYDVLKDALTKAERFKPYVNGNFNATGIFTPFIVTQISGPHIDLPRSLQSEHPLKSERDARDYLARLRGFKRALTDVAATLRADVERGIVPPRFAFEGAINTIDKMTRFPPGEHPLVVNLSVKLETVADLDAATRAALVGEATALVDSHVYPGYTALKHVLREELPMTSDTPGIWALEDGDRRYELALQTFGAAGKTARDIHELGLSEVARIQAEMDDILKRQGYTEGGVIERYLALSKEKRFIYPDTDRGREELLEKLNAQIDTVTGRLPDILLTLPKAGVEVRRIPEHEQDGAPGGYYTGPSLDGSRPGIYWINLKDTADWPKFTLPTLTYHEASPGHHLQVSIAQEIEDMPMIRNMLWYSAYGEGWALYAERLAKELGLYENDPFGDLGRLQSELFRAARLVVDTGLHHNKWSRERAIDYMHKTTGESLASVTREVERYSVWPGQACSYKLGQLKILALRARARRELGERFDPRAFNDQLLIKGAVPLTVLEADIGAWIESLVTSQ